MRGPHVVLDRVSPRRQSHWDARAATNFICGGAGSGLLVATALASLRDGGLRPLVVLALALIGAGLMAVWFEIGRPLRALNVYRNAATSWMTREAMIAPVLFVSGAAAVLFNWAIAFWIAGLFGLGYAYAQGRMLYANKGIPAWRHPGAARMIVATSLTEGAGLLCAAAWYRPALAPFGIVLAGLVCVRFLVWRNYLASLRCAGAPSGTLTALVAIDTPFFWVGHAAPVLVAVAAALVGSLPLVAIAGVLAAGAGAWFKYTLVCRAAFTQGFALPRTPSRGAGAAGAGGKPGWAREQSL
jgi:phenylacetyl-CoA:acceptor oxidoreductase subunit 2